MTQQEEPGLDLEISNTPGEGKCWLLRMLQSASGFETGTFVIREEKQAGQRWNG